MIALTNQMRYEFDYVFIDCPAGIESGFRNAIAGADEVLIVTTPEVSAVRDADRVVGLVEASEKGPARLVINRLNPRMVSRGEMLSMDEVVEILAIDALGVVPEDEYILSSTNRGEAVVFIEEARAGQAFVHIARRLAGENLPLMEISDQQQGVLDRLIGGLFGRKART
jgi:septum site-determining protein MinD